MSDSHKRIAIVVDNRISGLPRNLKDSILDRMPIQDAARTSILSRKWRHVWSEHPNLVFDKHFFEENMRNKPLCAYEYVNVISKTLLLHIGPVLKFTIYVPDIDYDWDLHITQWLLFLTRNGIKELILDNQNLEWYKLPTYVFSCPGLTCLNIRRCSFRLQHAFDGFRNLIGLDFKEIRFVNNLIGTSVPTPTHSMPLLESLIFESCTGIEHFNIHAPKLKTLYAIRSCNVKLFCFNHTPNLTVLCIRLGKIIAENLRRGTTINLSKLLVNFARIGRLWFDGYFLKVLAAGPLPEKLSITLNQLSRLVFDLIFDDLDQMSCVLCLLRSSPKLMELCITASAVEDNGVEPDLSYFEALGCLDRMLNQLRIVHIVSIKGLRSELLFIKCILAYSPLLEKVRVQYDKKVDAKEGFRISKELMRFRRASANAEIVYI